MAQLAWYRLSDESGDPVADSSGNGYEGAMNASSEYLAKPNSSMV